MIETSSSDLISPSELAPAGILSAILPKPLHVPQVVLRLHLTEHGVHHFNLNSASVTSGTRFRSSSFRYFHSFYFYGFSGAIHHFRRDLI